MRLLSHQRRHPREQRYPSLRSGPRVLCSHRFHKPRLRVHTGPTQRVKSDHPHDSAHPTLQIIRGNNGRTPETPPNQRTPSRVSLQRTHHSPALHHPVPVSSLHERPPSGNIHQPSRRGPGRIRRTTQTENHQLGIHGTTPDPGDNPVPRTTGKPGPSRP